MKNPRKLGIICGKPSKALISSMASKRLSSFKEFKNNAKDIIRIPNPIVIRRDTTIKFFSEILGARIGWKKFLTKIPALRFRPESIELIVAGASE